MRKDGLKARLVDGKKLAATINKEIQEEIKTMVAAGKRWLVCMCLVNIARQIPAASIAYGMGPGVIN